MDHKGFGSIDRQRDSAESGQAVAGTPLRAVLDRDTSKLARRTVHPRMSPKPKRRIRRGAMIAVRQVKKIGQVTWRFIRPPKQRRLAIVNLASAALIVVSLVIPVASVWQQGQNYDLAAAKHLLSPTPQRLQDKLRYDHAKQAWQFNENPAEQLPAPGNNSVKVGGLTYSATLPTSLRSSAGLTMTDAVNKQDITLKPQFGLGDGQQRDGHVVYPLAGSQSQLVYTFQQNGVKEDIILYEAPGDTAEYRYDLQLPAGMEARLQSDGSIGIYGGNPALFGDISYGSDKDKALVEKARTSSDKTHLYYVIPAPIVTGNGTDMVKAQFELTGSTLLVKASGLAKAHYPLSIDPSFVMDTNCSWKQGNNEGNISYDGCELSRSGLTGGTLGTWTNNTATIPVSVRDHQAVVVNGYLYIFDSGLAYYAAINDTTGEVGTLNPTTITPPSRHKFALTAVNGYIYLLGGQDSGNPTRTVYVAEPQTGGNITSWTTLSSLMNSPRSNQAVATYNNRIYVAGGCTNIALFSGSCDNHVGTVEYATVQGDGSLSAWTNTTSLPTVGTFNLTSYNGYLYTAGSNDDVASNSVLYIAINSDGSLDSSWTATTNLPVPLVGLRPIAYKGHLYIIGGGTDLTNYVSTVYVAKIYANGAVGPFNATTSMNSARYKAAAVTYNDRLYMVAGCSATTLNDCETGTILNTIEYTTITAAPGGTSSYSATSTISTVGGIYAAASVAYGGYLYLVGGTTSSTGSASAQLGTLQYAQINPDGSLGAWQQSSTSFNQVQTGTGTFCATAGSCPGRMYVAAGVHNGYLYIAGGKSNGNGTAWSDVQSAPLNPTTGAPGTWTTLIQDFTTNSTSYSNANGMSHMSMQIHKSYMYLIGGLKGAPGTPTVMNTIYYAALTPTGGVGTFTPATSLPSIRANPQSFVANDNLYVVGGGNGLAADNDDVIFTKINSDGTLASSCPSGYTCTSGSWVDANATVNGGSGSSFYPPGGATGFRADFSNGYLYISGGANGYGEVNSFNTVKSAKLNTNGSLGSWNTLPSFTTQRFDHGQVIANGFIYILGGCRVANILNPCNGGVSDVLGGYQYAQIYNNGGGSDGTWANTTAIPSKVGGNLSVAANGYLYTIGGCDDFVTNLLIPLCSTLRNTVHYAKINTNGSIGAWTATTSMIDGNYIGEAVAYNNRIYVIGGCRQVNANPCSSYSDGVQFATICTGVNLPVSGCTGAGAVSAWQYTYNNTTSPTYTAGTGFNGGGRWYISATASNDGYMYIAGGTAAAPASPIADASQVQYAKINSDGTLGSWTNTSIYSTPRSDPALVTNGNYIYVGGGTTASAIAADVQYAEITSNGSLGSWNRTTDLALPYGSGASGVLNGYFYIWGGSKEAGNNSADDLMTNVQYAPIFASGKLGKWTVTPGFGDIGGAVGLVGFGGTIANGHLYVLGGFKFNTPDPDHITSTTSAHYAPIQSQPQIARYSILRSTDLPSNPANYFTNTTKQSQNSVIQIGFTAGTPAFGSVSTRSSHTNGTKYPLSISGDGASYYWLPIVLDDSKSMTFGESNSSTSRINYFQLNYHPNAGMRLRGGKTFNNNVQQSLDAY